MSKITVLIQKKICSQAHDKSRSEGSFPAFRGELTVFLENAYPLAVPQYVAHEVRKDADKLRKAHLRHLTFCKISKADAAPYLVATARNKVGAGMDVFQAPWAEFPPQANADGQAISTRKRLPRGRINTR